MDSIDVFDGDYGMFWFQNSHAFRLDFERIVMLLRKAIEAAGLWVLGEIDVQALLRRYGYVIGGAIQILTFHPRFMVRLLKADPAALLAAPLKFAVLALADGSVAVSWSNHAASFARYDRPALNELGLKLADFCADIVAAAIAGEA